MGEEAFYDEWRKGVYHCAQCDTALYSSADKFRAKNKYPAFSKPVSDNVIDFVEDSSFGIQRQAIVCKNCKARLGHKYSDIEAGTTKERHSLFSAKLKFVPDEADAEQHAAPPVEEVIDTKIVERKAPAAQSTVSVSQPSVTKTPRPADADPDDYTDTESDSDSESSDEEIPANGTSRQSAKKVAASTKSKPKEYSYKVLTYVLLGSLAITAVAAVFGIRRRKLFGSNTNY